ncbi:hypothetical protein EU805_05900 [Salipiger sp. IMCC34102]|uniref:hypothetical protein n=1 Tax=Salipiger sp. IMCC34102 TaxID=2510647 RepID=UPI00101C96D0|nr:hypothetical protein [Salipiger sp. IMCC34102]RYH03255.1 hypothetical protein EU805_05900 [Salipiger sp. IMCC34102]
MTVHSSTRALFAAGALVLMSACGGGGSALQGGAAAADALESAPRDRLTFAEIADVAAEVNDGYNDVPITPKSQVPTAGRADYFGAVGGDIVVGRNRTEVAGVMGLGVDFAANRVGGRLSNFVTRDGDEITGSLGVNNGVLNRQSNSRQVAIFGDVDGTLRSAAGERIVVDARLRESGFKGRNVEYIGGSVEGGVNVDGQPGSIDMRAQLER